ncbi:MAG: hypothetical protein IT177_16365 [Acidobacteria bacterium]|nr:hypothetical protein [Acidobacteriota bacterium]
MAPAQASALLTLLQDRKLDRTFTTIARKAPPLVAPLGIAPLDLQLRGGIPRGHLSEIVGPVSSGRTSLAWAALAAAAGRGEWVALVDTFDRFDPERAAEAGLDLSRLMWVRGQALSKTAGALDPAWVPGERSVQGPGTMLERTIDRGIKALNLVAQSGVCTLVVLDLIDAPAPALARVPRSTWLRLQHIVEGSEIALVLLVATPVARSAGGVSIVTGVGSRESGVEIATGREIATGGGIMSGGTITTGAEGVESASRQEFAPGSRHTQVRWNGTHDRTRRLGGFITGVRATSPRGFVGALPLAIG